MKSDRKIKPSHYFNYYWLLGFLIIIFIAMVTDGFGTLESNFEKVIAFKELFYYENKDYLDNVNTYNSLSYFNIIFSRGFMYLALIFPSISCMMQYCDEVNSGYSKLIVARIGNSKYIIKTILRTILTSFVVSFLALYSVYLILYLRLPSINDALKVFQEQDFFYTVKLISDFKYDGFLYALRYIVPSSLVACIAGLMSILVATFSHNKFLSLTVPLLLIESQVTIFGGSTSAVVQKYKFSNLTFPFDDYIPWFKWWDYALLILTLFVVLVTLIYYFSSRRYKQGE